MIDSAELKDRQDHDANDHADEALVYVHALKIFNNLRASDEKMNGITLTLTPVEKIEELPSPPPE